MESNAHLYLGYFYQGDRDIRVMRYALRDPVRLSGDITKRLSDGGKVCFIPESRMISTGTFFKEYMRTSDKFGINSQDINNFLSRFNFALIPHGRYTGRGAYKGNTIYIFTEKK